jgi:DNA processing protein
VRFVSRSGGLHADDLDFRIVDRSDPEYPPLLNHLPDPPSRLWVAGREVTSLPPCVAVVGTRTPNHYGEEMARALASDFGRAGMCVVSGMARGIDAFAHEGALVHGTTIAVLPGGIDRCYPASNRDLYEQIYEEGALVAEVPPGTTTHKRRFTHRNRIIAGLSLAVVVVQAGEPSGALATANHALTVGRDVFAVPGDVRVDVSAGVHQLLRDGAAPCTCAGDVLERIAPELERVAAQRTLENAPDAMPAAQSAVLALLGGETMSLGSIIRGTGLGASAVAVAITKLELAGWVARGPGALIHRVR